MRNVHWVMIFIMIITIQCGREGQNSNQNESLTEGIPVKVANAIQKPISETVKITGEIIPFYQLDIYPKANGIVVSETVTLGSRVKKNHVLAEIRQDIPGMEFSLIKVEATNNGVISMDNVEIGAQVSVQRPMYTISQIEQVYMVAKLIESLLGKVKVGKFAEVEIDAYPEKYFKGEITEISPVLDRLSRTANIKIRLNNSDFLLKPGMFASAYLTIGKRTGVMVPLDAIMRSGINNYLFCVKEGKAKQVSVEIGVIDGNYIEIMGPVKSGDQIVVLGQNMLEDDIPVRLIGE